jgi:hypothetical protein
VIKSTFYGTRGEKKVRSYRSIPSHARSSQAIGITVLEPRLSLATLLNQPNRNEFLCGMCRLLLGIEPVPAPCFYRGGTRWASSTPQDLTPWGSSCAL